MKIACGTVTFREYPLQEALRRIRDAGYEYAEPQATPPFCPHVDVDKDDPAEFRRMLGDMGLAGATALWATCGALWWKKNVEYGKNASNGLRPPACPALTWATASNRGE